MHEQDCLINISNNLPNCSHMLFWEKKFNWNVLQTEKPPNSSKFNVFQLLSPLRFSQVQRKQSRALSKLTTACVSTHLQKSIQDVY